MKIKLVASDIDGTLYRSDQTISDYTVAMIARLQAAGVQFILATGRSYEGALPVIQRLGIDKPGYGLVSLNGLRTYRFPGKDYIQARTMSYQECEFLEAIGHKYYMGILYFYDEISYFEMDKRSLTDYEIGLNRNNLRYFRDNIETREIHSVTQLKDRFDQGIPILKVVFIQSDEYMHLVKDRIRQELGEAYSFARVGLGWGEIMPVEINKGAAVLAYGESLGIKAEEIMAFGDAENDLDMLSMVGHGIAMSNAMDSVKLIADDQCLSNDEDGEVRYLLAHDIVTEG